MKGFKPLIDSLKVCVCVLSCAVLAGCVDDSLGTVPVTGVVELDGKPVEGATVVFKPDGEGRAASGTTDAQGKFKLTTEVNGDGALPGNYKVGVTKYEGGGLDLPKIEDASDSAAMDAIYNAAEKQGKTGKPAKNLVGAKYSNPDGSGLTAEVKDSGTNEFSFKVTSK